MSGAGVPSSFRPDIEGLRAIAVLLVVAYHAGVPGVGGGYVGVDVFFVLSGYLITGLLVREAEATGTVALGAFYARRARRLLPAVLVVLVAVVAVGAAVFAPFEQIELARSAWATAAYVSNVHFARGQTDYLGAASETNPFLHTWSLAVEEQFYLAWPLVVMVGLGVLAFGTRVRRGAVPSRRRLVWTMTAIAAASFALCVALTATRQPWAFFLSPPRAWEFALGALGALVAARPRIDTLLGPLGLVGILASAVAFGAETPFPGWAAALPVLSTVAVLRAAAARPDGRLARGLGARPLQTLGRLSYSWYLWHWPALVVGAALVPHVGLGGRVALAAASLGPAWASYRFVEGPVRHSAFLARRPRAALALAGVATVVGVALALGWGRFATHAAEDPSQRHVRSARADLPALYASGCHAGFEVVAADVAGCLSGDDRAGRTIVLLGDSHAAQWQPALENLAESRGWRLVSLTKSSCPAVDAPLYSTFLRRTYTECAAWRRSALAAVGTLRPALVVVTSEVGRDLGDDVWEAGTGRVLASLRTSGARVVLLRDTPAAPFDVLTCLARHVWRGGRAETAACSFAGRDPRPTVWAAQRRAAARTGVATADLTEAVCPGGTCNATRSGRITWRDRHHLTTTAAQALAPALADAVGM